MSALGMTAQSLPFFNIQVLSAVVPLSHVAPLIDQAVIAVHLWSWDSEPSVSRY